MRHHPAAPAALVVATCALAPLAAGAQAAAGIDNPAMAPGGPSGIHDGAYAQQSSRWAGPTSGEGLEARFLATDTFGVPLVGPVYPDGRRAAWLSTHGFVYKLELSGSTMRVIDALAKPSGLGLPRADVERHVAALDAACSPLAMLRYMGETMRLAERVSSDGVYAVTTADGRLLFSEGRNRLVAYGDAGPEGMEARVARLAAFEIPPDQLSDPAERLYGLMPTWDGHVAFVTTHGLVGVVAPSLDPASARYLRLAGERVSNSIAADETGGVYVVTDKAMHRVQWTGQRLSRAPEDGAWTAAYTTGGDQGDIRLGGGSGSTPTLMGGPGDPDRLVVITDGAARMNIVAFWRDAIPADWQGLPGKDRRIAGEFPVTFGDPTRTSIQSEQSVLVSGYGAFVVNNTLESTPAPTATANVFLSGLPGVAPRGAERFAWDPNANRWRSVWARTDVSFPNTIPFMSAPSGVIYGVGARPDGNWTLLGLDWTTGATRIDFGLGRSIRWNTTYMPTTVFPDGAIVYGSAFGVVRIAPAGR
jgi:hypothetical protein